jgi:hypothetical protein
MAKYDLSIREEELKNKVARDWFGNYDTTQIIDNVDFVVAIQPSGNEIFKKTEYLLWAEAKKGNKHNIYDSVIQLIFTIGKGRINERNIPPKYIGAFDAEKIAFIPYSAIMAVFSQTDFNWKVAPSDHGTKEFLQLKNMVRNALELSTLEDGNEAYKFDFEENRKELKTYISKNFKTDSKTNRGMRITQNNFVAVYNQWRKEVMPTIAMPWEVAKKHNILDADFFLADLMLGKDKEPIMDKLRVLLMKTNKYQLKKEINELGLFNNNEVGFRDNMVAYRTFWARYDRPPRKEYWDKIVERRDLLVPQDIREVKGSYFTPPQWVVKSQEYLADVLHEDWQDKYYIWDCCAGTGNLLANLTNKHRIWASTLDLGDVQVMHERIQHMEQSNPNGSNLLDSHVFQFDFLNDDLQSEKVPEDLRRILADPDERKKLVIYINPPYKEATNARTVTGTGQNQSGATINNKTYEKYKDILGKASKELFAQFFIRIYQEIPSCRLAEFSKLKILQAPNFADFRKVFLAKLEKAFIVPANTFDNVNGKFPIGFFIWDTSIPEKIGNTLCEVYEDNGRYSGLRKIYVESRRYINDWLKQFYIKDCNNRKSILYSVGNDFQHSVYVFIQNGTPLTGHYIEYDILPENVLPITIYNAVRHVIPATWINDRDQFFYPRKAWIEDVEFRYDCLAYTLFNTNVQSQYGINHWIPFTEEEVSATMRFESHFMSDFIAGKIKPGVQKTLFGEEATFIPSEPIQFSPEAQAVMDAGRKIWHHYMHHKDNELYGPQSINVNASFYDIRRYFQGVNEKGIMNKDSKDAEYMRLWDNIKKALEILAKKIAKKVYLYGFLLDETTLPEDERDIVEQQEPLPAKPAKRAPKTKPKKQQQMVVNNYGTVNIYEK